MAYSHLEAGQRSGEGLDPIRAQTVAAGCHVNGQPPGGGMAGKRAQILAQQRLPAADGELERPPSGDPVVAFLQALFGIRREGQSESLTISHTPWYECFQDSGLVASPMPLN